MLEMKDKGILLQIIKHCERISFKMKDISKDSFKNDMDIREIVCFNIFQIGELAKKLSEEFIKEYNKIPWKYVKGMRDRIGHGYDTIDTDIVYETALINIPELYSYCMNIINEA